MTTPTRDSAPEGATAPQLEPKPPHPDTVAVLGGGIGGLATALALAKHGIPAHVMERRAAFETEGAGIQIGPNGTRILADLGVAERLEPHVGKPYMIHVRDAARAETLARLPLGQWIADRHGAPYWVAHRADLHDALREVARQSPLVTMSLGFCAEAIADTGAGVSVRDQAGHSVEARCLIAADGIRSQVRASNFGASAPFYAGKSAARAVIAYDDLPKSLRENATAIWLAPGAHVVHYPLRGSSEVAIVFVRDEHQPSEDWNTEVPREWVLENTGRFAEALRMLLEAPKQWRKWALYELAPLPTWAKGRIALLGDAAHPTLPFLAQGGVLALEDASVIAREIAARPSDPVAALAAYDRARRSRATRVVAQARRNGQIYHLKGSMALARDVAMRLTPPERLMARYDWIYGWRG